MRRILPYLSFLDAHGKPRNDLAAECAAYSAKSGVLVRCQRYPNRDRLIYTVKMDHGEMVRVTEDCLMPVREFHGASKAQWHRGRG